MTSNHVYKRKGCFFLKYWRYGCESGLTNSFSFFFALSTSSSSFVVIKKISNSFLIPRNPCEYFCCHTFIRTSFIIFFCFAFFSVTLRFANFLFIEWDGEEISNGKYSKKNGAFIADFVPFFLAFISLTTNSCLLLCLE